jgi:predicted ATPase/DNA-binding CsgD family transcriptional regulator
MNCADHDGDAYPGRVRIYPIANTDSSCARSGPNTLGSRRDLHDNATVGADLPLVARGAELAVLTGAIEAAKDGRGEAVLLTGEAGVGKTRLLLEAQDEAKRQGLMVLKGRAVQSGGAYRPLVEAFARASARFADETELAGVRPILARVLPGWVSNQDLLAPMADPAAVLAEALILLLQPMAPSGAVLLMDDLHWADEDTISVLSYLADSVEQLPLVLIMAARTEPLLPEPLERITTVPSIRRVPLSRLTRTEVGDTLREQQLPGVAAEIVDQLVIAVDGLPLVLDEFVRQLRETPPDGLDMKHTTLAAAVQLRLGRVSSQARVVLDAMSVLGEPEAELLTAITGLDEATLSSAIHDAVSSTLLVVAATPLGITWRHPLMRDAVRDLLLPLEQQALARRAAEHLVSSTADPTEGQLRLAAEMYQLAGYPDQAARQLIRAARAAVRNAALDVAEQHLAAAQALTGRMPEAASNVLIERIETLTLAGRAADGYHSGIAALQGLAASNAHRLLVATARAAYSAGLRTEAGQLLVRLEEIAEPTDLDLAVLRARAALLDRQARAIELGQLAASQALDQGSFEIACEALLIAGIAARRRDINLAARTLQQTLALSEAHQLSIWQVQALAELGVLDVATDSDPTRDYEARERATAAGMLGTVTLLDTRIGQLTASREGFMAAYPIYLRADAQARQLQLISLYAGTRAHLAECVLFADDRPLPGRTRPAASSEFDDLVAEALAAGKKSSSVPWALSGYGLRAWLHGDSSAAIRLIDESMRDVQDEWHIVPWWGVGALLHVVAGTALEEAFGSPILIGHHANRAARSYGAAVWELRHGLSASESIAEADHMVRNTPLHRHMLRTIIAPVVYQAGLAPLAEGWLREADAFCSAAGERALQRRVRNTLASIGAKVPKGSTSAVPPHLARLGITAREAEILRLVNAGLSNADISHRLFISARTVESHVSSMLQKTGRASREQLPSASSSED